METLDMALALDELQAEVARLQNENDHIRSQFLDCAGHNARLRAALETERTRAECAAAEFRRVCDNNTKLRAALEPLAAIVRKWSKDHLGGHIGDDDEVYVTCKLLFAVDKALAEQED